MKINIASPGRFHVMDLARELDKLGFDVRFYSFVPDKRAEKFGLRKECNASLFYWMLPFLILQKIFPLFKITTIKFQDWLTGRLMRRCDILIAMSGNYVYTLKKAKQQGAIVILERGSKHILEQKRILESVSFLSKKKPVPKINVKRELIGYKIADYIAIASQHVKHSFLLYNYPEQKLFVNPYGVDLRDFKLEKSREKKFDIIMVGGWNYRKGVDLLQQACEELHLSLIHVGAIGNATFPANKLFKHINPVDQKQLKHYYSEAKILVLPSREDGFGLVLIQALSCGLPIVCSKNTGGQEIANTINIPSWIFEMQEYTVDSLKIEILKALTFAETCNPQELNLENLSWEAYGKRYAKFLNKIEED